MSRDKISEEVDSEAVKIKGWIFFLLRVNRMNRISHEDDGGTARAW